MPIKKELHLPVVVNTGGYDTPEQLGFFEGLADIYLPDFKFGTPEEGAEFAHAPDYERVAEAALWKCTGRWEIRSSTGEGCFKKECLYGI